MPSFVLISGTPYFEFDVMISGAVWRIVLMMAKQVPYLDSYIYSEKSWVCWAMTVTSAVVFGCNAY